MDILNVRNFSKIILTKSAPVVFKDDQHEYRLVRGYASYESVADIPGSVVTDATVMQALKIEGVIRDDSRYQWLVNKIF